ncbi:MAG: efflux RND transporter periplasmic adaptor subunit [Bacteroidetes bacterium]|nr:efflux RND transporter periplasmic adaptor subunit [Bacteroidota bacterium]
MKYIILPLAALMTFAACKNKTAETTTEEHGTHSGMIHLSADQIKRSGVAWSAAEQKAINAVLPLTGELRIQPENKAMVSAPADGFITSLHVRLNESVKKGAVIATLRKTDLLDLQQSYLETRDRITFLQSEYTRYNALRADDATAAKNVQKAQSELKAAITTGEMLAAKLKLYGIDTQNLTTANVRTELTIVAPLSGVVTDVHLSSGAAVQAGAPICEMADFTALHADLFVFEKDMLKVKPGQKVDISFPGAPDKKVTASLFSIDRTLDPEKNAVRAHARIENNAGLNLVDGAYCDARLSLETAAPTPVVPADAIVREGLEEFIVLLDHEQDGDAFFKPVKVQTLGSENGFTAFRTETPLPAQAIIVQKGAYFVWSQGKVEEFGEEH